MGSYTVWFANQLTPGLLGEVKTRTLIGQIDILDIVWLPRSIAESYSYSFSYESEYCYDSLQDHPEYDGASCETFVNFYGWSCYSHPVNSGCPRFCGFCSEDDPYVMYPDDRESIYPQYSYDDESEYVVVYFKNRQYNWNEDGWGIDQKNVVDSILAQAPYVEGAIRMTLINGRYWPNTQYLMEVATSGTHTAQTKWSPAQWVGDDDITHGPRIVLTNQVFIWYTSGPEGWGQNYEPIRRASWSEMYDIFRNDTNTFARSLAPWCAGARLV